MTVEQETLFKLLRIALGNECDYSLPLSLDWKAIIDMSFEQGVAALAVDGLQKIYDANPNLNLDLDKPELEDLKYEWFGEVMNVEQDFAIQWTAACNLAELFKDAGIKTYVLKGFSIAKYYPIPEHRSCCDFDCFLANDADSAFELSNQLLEKRGFEIDKKHYKHYSFVYNGLHVENHRFCTGIRGKKWLKEFEGYLQGVLASSDKCLDGSCIIEPPTLFNSLFFIQHAHNHFLHEGITLRHLCDWAVLMDRIGDDVIEFEKVCQKYGLKIFKDSLTRLVRRWLCGEDIALEKQDMRLLDDIYLKRPALDSGNGFAFRRQLVKNELSSAWKYHYFSARPMLVELAQQTWGYLFDKNPEID